MSSLKKSPVESFAIVTLNNFIYNLNEGIDGMLVKLGDGTKLR